MARTVKEHEYADRRNDILDALQRLIFTKGYERLTLRDVYAELKISGGAFYHYFDSKSAVLAAFIARMQEEAEKPLRELAHDPRLSATEKLQGFFAALDPIPTKLVRSSCPSSRAWATTTRSCCWRAGKTTTTGTLSRRSSRRTPPTWKRSSGRWERPQGFFTARTPWQ